MILVTSFSAASHPAKDGKITTEGLDPHGPSDVFFSVTGGTGAFEGASGEAEYIDTTQTDIIIRLDN